MVAPLSAFPERQSLRPHAGPAASRRYERRRPVIGWFKRHGFLDAHAAEGCCETHEKPRSHDTSRRQRPS